MRRFIIPVLAIPILAIGLRAAVVEGVVLDEDTGNPLARTEVPDSDCPRVGFARLQSGEMALFPWKSMMT